MQCEQAQELISQWLDGELAEEEQRQLQAHLDCCPDCRETEHLLRAAQNTMQAYSVEPPAALHDNVMHQIHRESKTRRTKSLIPAVSIVAAAAVVTIMASAGVIALPGFGKNDTVKTSIFQTMQSSQEQDSSFAYAYAQEHQVTVLAIWTNNTPDILQDLAYTEETNGSIYSVSGDVVAFLMEQSQGFSRMATYEPDTVADETRAVVILFAE